MNDNKLSEIELRLEHELKSVSPETRQVINSLKEYIDLKIKKSKKIIDKYISEDGSLL